MQTKSELKLRIQSRSPADLKVGASIPICSSLSAKILITPSLLSDASIGVWMLDRKNLHTLSTKQSVYINVESSMKCSVWVEKHYTRSSPHVYLYTVCCYPFFYKQLFMCRVWCYMMRVSLGAHSKAHRCWTSETINITHLFYFYLHK